MINTSAEYNPYSSVRRIGANVNFAMTAIEANPQNLSVFASPSLYESFFSERNQLVNGVTGFTKKIATIETDGWILDGTYDYIDEKGRNGQIGFWNRSLSLANNSIAPVTLNVSAKVPFLANKITVIFDETIGVWATDFSVTYRGEGTSKYVNVVGNESPVALVDGCDFLIKTMSLRFTKVNLPGKLLRVCQILMGEMVTFDSEKIVALDCLYSSSVYGESFPSSELVFVIDNSSRQYNMVNPSGVFKFLREGQAVNAEITVDGHLVQMGQFYFEHSESSDNSLTATIRATDQAWFLDSVEYQGGTDGTWTVQEALDDIIAQTGINIQYSLPAEIYSAEVRRSIPTGTTCREAIRMIAQAVKCVCFFSRLEILTFVKPEIGTSQDVLDFDVLAEYPEVINLEPVNRVEVIVRNEYTGTETVYSAEAIVAKENGRTLSVENPVTMDGQGLAEWILEIWQNRIDFSCEERGNPARELEDTISVFDAYGGRNLARVINEEFSLKNGLSGKTKVVSKGGV